MEREVAESLRNFFQTKNLIQLAVSHLFLKGLPFAHCTSFHHDFSHNWRVLISVLNCLLGIKIVRSFPLSQRIKSLVTTSLPMKCKVEGKRSGSHYYSVGNGDEMPGFQKVADINFVFRNDSASGLQPLRFLVKISCDSSTSGLLKCSSSNGFLCPLISVVSHFQPKISTAIDGIYLFLFFYFVVFTLLTVICP